MLALGVIAITVGGLLALYGIAVNRVRYGIWYYGPGAALVLLGIWLVLR